MTRSNFATRPLTRLMMVATVAATVPLVAASSVAAATIPFALSAPKSSTSNFVQLAHAQSFRHCHNVHHRVYCHKRERLPMYWPPFSGEKNRGCSGKRAQATDAASLSRC